MSNPIEKQKIPSSAPGPDDHRLKIAYEEGSASNATIQQVTDMTRPNFSPKRRRLDGMSLTETSSRDRQSSQLSSTPRQPLNQHPFTDSSVSVHDFQYAPTVQTSGVLLSDQPSRDITILTLPQHIRKLIFSYVLPIDSTIRPTYVQGMLINGLHSSPFNDESVSKHPNIDSAIVRVNRALHAEVTRLLYGSNKFIFTSAEICHWWCKRIGASNIGSMTKLKLTLGTAWRDPQGNDIHGCEEELWFLVLQFLRPIHHIRDLHVTLYGWKDLQIKTNRQELGVDLDTAAVMVAWRRQAVQALSQLRGLHRVTINRWCCDYIDDGWVDQVIAYMSLPRGPPRPPAPKVSLEELIVRVTIHRLQREEALARRDHMRRGG